MYKILIHKKALKDLEKIKQVKALKAKVESVIDILKLNPFKLPYEKLEGDLSRFYSRRLSKQHRLVYEIKNDTIIILSMWSHYESL